MYQTAKMLYLHAITPLHAGSGTELGIVDMPIQREKHTGFPKIEGSGLKGSIRNVLREMPGENNPTEKELDIVFGPENGNDHAGAVGFTDARILLFPVKSAKGIFAYVTCPFVLEKYKQELGLTGVNINRDKMRISDDENILNCYAPRESINIINDKILLEEYVFTPKTLPEFALITILEDAVLEDDNRNRIVIVDDDSFREFVQNSTDVITRTKIDIETGTVQSGALFTEEYLPAETIMYSLALATPQMIKGIKKKSELFIADDKKKEAGNILKYVREKLPNIIQIGGNSTIGKGLVKIVWQGRN